MKNKLIAEFMGEVKTFDVVDNDTYRGEITLSKGLTEEQIEDEISHFEDRYSVTPIVIEEPLQYHTSWDWLMPVIENIDHLQYEPVKSIEKALSTRHLGDTYQAVVEFINQYNTEQLQEWARINLLPQENAETRLRFAEGIENYDEDYIKEMYNAKNK